MPWGFPVEHLEVPTRRLVGRGMPAAPTCAPDTTGR